MEASRPQPPRPEPFRVDREVIESHLKRGEPLPAETARTVWLLNVIVGHDPELALPGEW